MIEVADGTLAAILVLIGLLAIGGWVWLAATGRLSGESWWPLVSGLAGLIVIALVLLSPLDQLGDRIFSVHMALHLVLMYIAAPLLVLAWPVVFGLARALARPGQPVARLLSAKVRAPLLLAGLGHPVTALLLSIAGLWIWHLPTAYDLALQQQAIHDAEHLTYLATFVLYWWVLLGRPPYQPSLRGNAGRGLYLLASATLTGLLGSLIAFSNSVIYTFYLSVPSSQELSVLQDQQLGGAIMLLCGPLVYGLAAVLTMKN